MIADRFDDVTLMFADIVDFTRLSARLSPEELVGVLNEVFTVFDGLVDRYGLEKIKTIGDAYMVVGGLPERPTTIRSASPRWPSTCRVGGPHRGRASASGSASGSASTAAPSWPA